jgi:hypothetical protein
MKYNELAAKTITLTRKDFRVVNRADKAMIDTITDGSIMNDYMTNQLVYSLRSTVYGVDHEKKHVISYPADWIESLKKRFAPKWFLKRSPVRMRNFEASLTELFPTLTPTLSDHPPVFQFRVYESPTYTYYER